MTFVPLSSSVQVPDAGDRLRRLEAAKSVLAARSDETPELALASRAGIEAIDREIASISSVDALLADAEAESARRAGPLDAVLYLGLGGAIVFLLICVLSDGAIFVAR